jgi:uncharacterized membrane protein
LPLQILFANHLLAIQMVTVGDGKMVHLVLLILVAVGEAVVEEGAVLLFANRLLAIQMVTVGDGKMMHHV